MKYLLVLVVVMVGVWMWLRGREAERPAAKRRRRRRPEAAPMVVCAHCGVHLPRPEAVTDARGQTYCSDAHRLAGPH